MPIPYERAYNLACEELTKLKLEEVAFNSSARLENDTIYLNLIDETFVIKEHGKEITLLKPKREVKISEKILLLHYLITADGTPLQREEVTLQDIKGASFYYPTYKTRTIDLIINKFSPSPSKFLTAAKSIGFNVTETTNQFYRLKSLVLPNVPISFILWKDTSEDLVLDNESLKILYDVSITHYLPLEDIIILTELVCHKIIKSDAGVSYLK